MPFSMKLARFARRALLCSAILVTLLALAFLVENWRGDRAWREHEEALQAMPPLLQAFPAPSRIPDAQNFMRTPTLEKFLFAPTESVEMKACLKQLPLNASNIWIWVKGKRFDFSSFAAAQVPAAKQNPAPLPSAPKASAAEVLSLLDPAEPILNELRGALAERPLSEIKRPVPINPLAPFSAPITRFQFVRGINLALISHACASLSLGQNAVGLEDTLAALRFCRGFLDTPDVLLIEAMIGTSLMTMNLQPVWEGTRLHLWNEAQLGRLQSELSKVHALRSLGRSMEAERLGALLTMEHVTASTLLLRPSEIGLETRFHWSDLLVVPHGWVQQNKVGTSQAMQHHIDLLRAAGTSSFLSKRADCDRFEKSLESSSNFNPYRVLTLMALPAFRKVTQSATAADARVSLALSACALERYHLAKGGYPESLSALVPDYLPAVPLDPINGQPLRYHSLPGGTYKLYSLGLNGTDEAGTSDPDLDKGDWTWPELN